MKTVMKRQVAEAAEKILREEGLVALTVNRIATEIGISRGALYNYFADRDALLDFIEERMAAPLQTAVDGIAAGNQDPTEKLERIGGAILFALVEDRPLVAGMLSTKAFSGSRCQCSMEHRRRVLRAIQSVVEQGVDTRQFRVLAPAWVAEVFLNSIVGLADTMVSSEETRTPDEMLSEMMETILPSIVQGP